MLTLKAVSGYLCKYASRQSTSKRYACSMLAWKVADSLNNHSEKISDKLRCTETKVPTISTPSEVLVKVHATSINPIDVRMCYGYGRQILDLLDIMTNFETRTTNDRYPLTLGRDFSGEIVAVGPKASMEFKPGDLVYGAIEPYRSGAHAEYVTLSSKCVTKKPSNLTHGEAASIPFVALTAYSAICSFGGLTERDCANGKSILVLGGSGGVGSFAIQLLKSWGASVVATCSEEKIDYLENVLFVEKAIDYRDQAQMETLKNRFDFVLDCGDYDKTSKNHSEIIQDNAQYLKPYSQSVYVTLSPPILRNTDENGIITGGAKTAIEMITDTLAGLRSFNSARWAVFLPNKSALQYISNMYETEAIQPQVHAEYSFEEIPKAFLELQEGRARGKVIVDVTCRDK